MKTKVKIETDAYPELDFYKKQIPEDLWDIFIPYDETDLLKLSYDIKRLRIKEKERQYVLEIQNHYGLPIRPNATLKETMIRVRLKFLKKRKSIKNKNENTGNEGTLPVDPLE